MVLFKCEWFWAEINQLRNELSKNSRKKHHLRSICINSLKYIKELKSLSQGTFDIGSNLRLEYLSYVNLLEGIVRNELKEFSTSFTCLQKSKIILEELIERNFQVPLLETKISELETVMRVCQYSADMYDVLIEVNEDELNEFKINQLSEKLSESKIDDEIKKETISFGSKSFKLSPEVKLIDLDSKNLKLSLNILKKQVEGTAEYENARIQLAYFENLFCSKLLKRCFRKVAKKGPKAMDCSKVLKKLTKAVALINVDEKISKTFDLVARLLWYLSNIYGNKDKLEVSKNASEALNLIKAIKSGPYSGRLSDVVLTAKKRLIPQLNVLLIGKAIYSVKGAAPVPPKPSFYDIAFNYLSYEATPALVNQEIVKPSGFSNLLSGFWGKK